MVLVLFSEALLRVFLDSTERARYNPIKGGICLISGLSIFSVGAWLFKNGVTCSTQKGRIAALEDISEMLEEKIDEYVDLEEAK